MTQMMHERAQAYLELAELTTPGPWIDPEIEPIYSAGVLDEPEIAECRSSCADARFIALSRTEGVWAAQKLLEALDVLAETTGTLMLAIDYIPTDTEHQRIVRQVCQETVDKVKEFAKGGDSR